MRVIVHFGVAFKGKPKANNPVVEVPPFYDPSSELQIHVHQLLNFTSVCIGGRTPLTESGNLKFYLALLADKVGVIGSGLQKQSSWTFKKQPLADPPLQAPRDTATCMPSASRQRLPHLSNHSRNPRSQHQTAMLTWTPHISKPNSPPKTPLLSAPLLKGRNTHSLVGKKLKS